MGRKVRKPVPTVRHLGGAVDRHVEALVYALNDAGYDTWSSCEGGSMHDYPTGYIIVMEALDREDKEDVASILRKHTDIPFRMQVSKERTLTWIKFLAPLSGRETWEDLVRKEKSGESVWEDTLEEWLPENA